MSPEERNAENRKVRSAVIILRKHLEMALKYIDGIPLGTAVPAVPGFTINETFDVLDNLPILALVYMNKIELMEEHIALMEEGFAIYTDIYKGKTTKHLSQN